MNIVSIFAKFPTEADCIAHLEAVRWPAGPTCTYCRAPKPTKMPKEQRYHCNKCKTSFSVTVGTIFHHTHLPLQKWLLAVSLVLNAKKGLSARQLARDLEVNKNTGWRVAMQIRNAMAETEQRTLLQGIVEMDETDVGGKPRKGNSGSGGTGGKGAPRGGATKKNPVVGMVERGGRVKAMVSRHDRLKSKHLSALVRANVDIGNATLITDEYTGYIGIKNFMDHRTINHRHWYVDGDTVGQYHKDSLKHLPRYISEFSYRSNHRSTADVFDVTVARALGVTQ